MEIVIKDYYLKLLVDRWIKIMSKEKLYLSSWRLKLYEENRKKKSLDQILLFFNKEKHNF